MKSERHISGPLPLSVFAEVKRILATKQATAKAFIYAAAADLVENPDRWRSDSDGTIERR